MQDHRYLTETQTSQPINQTKNANQSIKQKRQSINQTKKRQSINQSNKKRQSIKQKRQSINQTKTANQSINHIC
jgi:hypothetical protein